MGSRGTLGYVSGYAVQTNYGTATGGIGSPTSVTIDGLNYQYLQFNATGTLSVLSAGFFDYLLFAGGAGGGLGWAGGNGYGVAVAVVTLLVLSISTLEHIRSRLVVVVLMQLLAEHHR